MEWQASKKFLYSSTHMKLGTNMTQLKVAQQLNTVNGVLYMPGGVLVFI